MKNIKKISLSDIKTRWKTVLAIAVVAMTSFSIGGFANPIIIQGVASLGGSKAPIPAPNLQILGTGFVNDPAGNITSVNLNATTVGSSPTLMSYHIIVKIFCMPPGSTSQVQCSSGNGDAILPGNMTPTGAATHAARLINVPLHDPVDPSTTEVESMSITTQAIPTPPGIIGGPFCTGGLALGTALPAADPNFAPIPPIGLTYSPSVTFSAVVGVKDFALYLRLDSICNLTGTVTLTTSINPTPGPVPTIQPNWTLENGATLPSGGSIFAYETIDVPNGLTQPSYTITVTACVSSACDSVDQIVNVFFPPF